MSKLKQVREMYDVEIAKIKHPELWQHTIECISRYYKFNFVEALLIHSQVKSATVMATFDNWNRFGRRINGGERGIAVIASRTDTQLKYLFDISQTHGQPIEKRWDIKESEEQRDKVIRRYNSKHGTDYADISGVIDSVYRSALESIREDIEKEVEYFKPENAEIIRKLISDSTFCMIMTRCGYEIPEEMLDFSAISEVIPDGLLIAVGNLSMKAAHEALMEIENAIRRKDYEQSKIQGHRVGVRGEGGRTAVSEVRSPCQQSGAEYQGETGNGYAERSQSLGFGRSEYERSERSYMGRDSRQSEREGSRNNEDYEKESAEGLERESAGADRNKSGSGTSGERAYAGISQSIENGGNDAAPSVGREGVEIAVTDDNEETEESSDEGGSLSLGLNNGNAIEIESVEDKAKAVISHIPASNEEYTQETLFSAEVPKNEQIIKDELLRGSGFTEGKERIERYYRENHPDTKTFALMLKKEYGIGGHSGKDDVRFINHNGKGISISFKNGDKITLTWSDAAKRIAKLIENGEYGGISSNTATANAEKLTVPVILCEWSESHVFEDGRTYSIAEFDLLMKQADNEHVAGKKAAIEKYGSAEVWYNSDVADEFTRFMGYDKVKFTLKMPDGRAFTERQDIGDGDGGVIDFLSKYPEYESIVPVLRETVLKNSSEISSQAVPELTADEVMKTITDEMQKNGASSQDIAKTEIAVQYLGNEDFRNKLNNYVFSKTYKENFHLNDNEKINYSTGEKVKFRDNIAAIRTLKKIEKEKRFATAEEQKILSKYVGWGGLSKAFDKSAASWSKEFIELKAILTDKEYEDALNSTLTAFYTDTEYIRPIYKTLDRFGFKGGNILDPAMGTGNFFSVIPEYADSHLYGVELDSVTGRIAKKLYPNADIRVQGFEYSNFEDGTFDVAVGNVPFENYKISDSAYKEEYVLHDYFFIKTLDKLKAGGIAAFITSSGTLDKFSQDARIEMANRAELIGAVRLPNNAFNEIAGAKSVTSDIIFLKKRDEVKSFDKQSPDLPDWVKQPNDSYNEQGNYVGSINRYFHSHPEMILGEHKMVSGPHGYVTQCMPKEGVILPSALETALSFLQAEFTAEPTVICDETVEDTEENRLPAPDNSQNYCFYVDESNNLYYRENEHIIPYKPKSAKAENTIKAMCKLSDKMQSVIDIQLKGQGNGLLQSAQKSLEDSYDAFVKKYGYLNKSENVGLFREDMRCTLLMSLEEETEETEQTGVYIKADFFTKATVSPKKTVESADSPQEALYISLSLKNKVDIPYMASLCGKTETEVISELGDRIYQNPSNYEGSPCSGWETAEEYLSGYVKDKLGIAMQFAEHYPNLFQRNVEALKANQPEPIPISDIGFSIGAVYIPGDMYRQFIYDTFETPAYYRVIPSLRINGNIDVEYSSLLNQWRVTNKSIDDSANANQVYGTSRINAYEIMEYSLNQKRVTINDPVACIGRNGEKTMKYVLNVNETQIARARQAKIETEFKNWVLKSPERIARIEQIYNDRFNNLNIRKYDGSYIDIQGLNPVIKLRSHQLNAIARIASGNNVMLAHEVGAGKTAAMAGAGMYMRSIGAVKKPLYVVPKPIVAQWGREFARFFPTAKVLVTDEKDFEKKNRRRFLSKIATGDFDAVIMSHSQFEKIPLSLERQEMIFNEIKHQLMTAKEKARESDGKRGFTVKAYAAAIKTLDKRLTKLRADFKKDDFITFEQLGCDYIFVDEAHHYKNLYTATKHTRVAGINSSANSQCAFDMDMKIAYLQEINGGGGVTMATGTPISNSIAECYVFQHYLQRPMLQKSGIDSFDEWASVYGNITYALEVKPTGSGWRMRERFAEFKNLPELCNMLSQCFDIVKTSEIEGIRLPEIAGGKPEIIVCEQSEDQAFQVAEGMERAEKIENKRVEPNEDNMLAVCSFMTKVSLDPRINDPDAKDWEGLKLNVCAKNIIQIGEQYPNSAQVVFCDTSTPNKNTVFTVYQALKDKLVSTGKYQLEEIAFIHDAENDRQRLQMFDKVNKGTIKVVIGSTSKLGTGVNMQRNLIAAHHLDAPYVPKDIEQRNGRIIRQGNVNDKVFVKYYSTKGTFDSYRWQLLEKKQRLISQVLSGKAPSRTCQDIDETALTFAEMKAATSDNPLIAEKMQTDNEVDRLKLLQKDWITQQSRYKLDIEEKLPSKLDRLNKRIVKLEKDIELLKANPVISDGFRMNIKKVNYSERTEAGEALIKEFKKYISSEGCKKGEPSEIIGKFRGFDINFFGTSTLNTTVRVTGRSGIVYDCDFSLSNVGACIRIENLVSGIPERKEAALREIERVEKELETSKQQYGMPFEYAEELDRLTVKQANINSRLEFSMVQEEVISEDCEEM